MSDGKKYSVGKIITICIVACLVIAANVVLFYKIVIEPNSKTPIWNKIPIIRLLIPDEYSMYPKFSGTVKEIKAKSANELYHKANEYDTFEVVKVIVPIAYEDNQFEDIDSVVVGESCTDISLTQSLIRVVGPEGDYWFYADYNTYISNGASDSRGLATINVGSEVTFAYGPKKDIEESYVYAVESSSSSILADDLIKETTHLNGQSVFNYICFVLIPSIVGGILLICFIFAFIKRWKKGENLYPLIIVFILAIVFALFIGYNIDLYLKASHVAVSSITVHAPIIYLYPESDEQVNVMLDLVGELTVTYPEYDHDEGWTVTASPDGTLTDSDGNTYPFLFWEGELNMNYDLSHGFCVKGSDTEKFLDDALAQLGLSESEASDFKSYWLPLMESNPYNVITFQTTAYDDAVSHSVTPEPDTVISVNMLWYASSEYVEIEPQDLTDINPALDEREGFVFVEWGGEEIDEV